MFKCFWALQTFTKDLLVILIELQRILSQSFKQYTNLQALKLSICFKQPGQ